MKVGVGVVVSVDDPIQQHAVREIYFDVTADDCRPVEVEVERLPHREELSRNSVHLDEAGPRPRGTSSQGRLNELTESQT